MMKAAALLFLGAGSMAYGQTASAPTVVTPTTLRPLSSLIEVELRAERLRFPVNSPVMLDFIVRNKTADFVQLDVPMGDLEGKIPAGFPLTGMGLPLEHVFSGENFRGLSLAIEGDPYVGDRVMMGPSRTVPPIVLAPFAEVGLRFDVTRFYPVLFREGRYEVRWRPYGGKVESRPLVIEVRPHKQVVMETEAGRLTFRLLYDKAPATVDNFLELVQQRFYDGLNIYLVDPSLALQGGCPKRDGTGRRPDGRTIPAEFNDTPFTLGTVGMSLSRLSASDLDPNSASCQFFIALTRQPVLDGRYTAFAQVEGPESMETLRKIADMPRGTNNFLLKPVVIKAATAVDAPLPPPTVQ